MIFYHNVTDRHLEAIDLYNVNSHYCFKIILFGILLRYNREEKHHLVLYLKIKGNVKIGLEMSWQFL